MVFAFCRLVEGVFFCVIGGFGFLGNLISILILVTPQVLSTHNINFSIISLPLQLWKHTFNRLLVALAVFDLMFVFSTVPIHVFPLFEYNNRLFALLYSR